MEAGAYLREHMEFNMATRKEHERRLRPGLANPQSKVELEALLAVELGRSDRGFKVLADTKHRLRALFDGYTAELTQKLQ